MKLTLALFATGLFTASFATAQDGTTPPKFSEAFLKHWATAKDLAIAVAKAMPAADYSFKPNPEEMSFGEQMVHIAAANYSYCSRIEGVKSTYQKPDKSDQDTAVQLLTQSFDYCSGVVEKTKDLDTPHGSGPQAMSGRELMLGVFSHMAHHRGQAEVYLRVKGVKPPTYKF